MFEYDCNYKNYMIKPDTFSYLEKFYSSIIDISTAFDIEEYFTSELLLKLYSLGKMIYILKKHKDSILRNRNKKTVFTVEHY